MGRFFSAEPRRRAMILQWLTWQMAGLRADARPEPSFRDLRAGEDPLRDRPVPEGNAAPLRGPRPAAGGPDFIADEYSIADMACYPWVVPHER